MTKAEYKAYEQAVASFFKREGIANLSSQDDEPWFSWRSCECCGSWLGGDREHCSSWNPTLKQVQEYDVCVDCVYYAEYGRLDDMTMLEVERTD